MNKTLLRLHGRNPDRQARHHGWPSCYAVTPGHPRDPGPQEHPSATLPTDSSARRRSMLEAITGGLVDQTEVAGRKERQ